MVYVDIISRLKMSYDAKEKSEKRNAEEDELFAAFYGHSDIQPLVERICEHLRQCNLEERYLTVLDKVRTKHDRMPKLALIVFAIWLCPSLELGKNSQPRRFEPFQKNIKAICMNILEGRSLSVQEFVRDALTDYLVTPKET